MPNEYNSISEGFYALESPEEPICIVHGYHCTDMGGQFVLGFNTHDGGGLLPISDLNEQATLTPVEFTKKG